MRIEQALIVWSLLTMVVNFMLMMRCFSYRQKTYRMFSDITDLLNCLRVIVNKAMEELGEQDEVSD